MHKPKVLMIAPGGIIHSLRPLNWLLENGCEVVFSDKVNPFPEGKDGYTFIRFPDDRFGQISRRLLGEKLGYRFFTWIVMLRLRLLWQRFRPNIVHVHWVDDRAYYCAKAGLHPLVLTVWGSDINIPFQPDANPSVRHRVGEALVGSDLILIDSADMHKKCAELAGRDVATELLTLGVNTDRFCPGYSQASLEWRHRLGIPADAIVLLSIRAWSPGYRHESILEAFARALLRLNSKAILVFKILKHSGTDRKPYEKIMRSLAEKLGVAGMVRWMEEVPLDVLPEVYSFANVILNYPSMDAFPVTFLEAAACECPVISCRLPAYAGTFAEEYFQLVSLNDLSELSDAIVEFVNQKRPANHESLAELRRIVCRDYDEKFVAERLIDIYRNLLPP